MKDGGFCAHRVPHSERNFASGGYTATKRRVPRDPQPRRYGRATMLSSDGLRSLESAIVIAHSKERHVSPSPSSDDKGQILKFRQRGSVFARPIARPPVEDLKKYETVPDEPDDYRHRMVVNGLGLLVTVLLIVAGVWIADVMAKMRKDQDCVLSGRRNCAHIDEQIPPR